MHSPFVFDFILNVLNNKGNYKAPAEIEQLRKQLLSDKRIIEIEDFGAGSRIKSSKQRSVGQIAKSALKSKKLAQVLFRLAKYYRPKSLIELGTSLGITTSYLSLAKSDVRVTTMEGSREIAKVARKNFKTLDFLKIQC